MKNKNTILPFGSAIISQKNKEEAMSLVWSYENSWGEIEGYFYNKPVKIIEISDTYHHLFFKKGYNPLTEADINKPSKYTGDAIIIVNPVEIDTSVYDIVT